MPGTGPVIERFAPSPTGLLHLGHAFSAWTAWAAARAAGGRFLVRIEDLDRARSKPGFVDAICRDLAWLGVDWDGPLLHQSARGAAYRDALAVLQNRGLTYRCVCTRGDIAQALAAPQEGVHLGPDGPVYPGTCRGRDMSADRPHAVRLDMAGAIAALGGADAVAALGFEELGAGPEGQQGWQALSARSLLGAVGDIVLCRRDGAVAYHLAVVVDDAHQGVTHVTRGCDLFTATPIHRVLQALLELAPPVYRHHRLIRDADGKRLAKRDDARAIAAYRAAGLGPGDVLAMVGLGG